MHVVPTAAPSWRDVWFASLRSQDKLQLTCSNNGYCGWAIICSVYSAKKTHAVATYDETMSGDSLHASSVLTNSAGPRPRLVMTM